MDVLRIPHSQSDKCVCNFDGNIEIPLTEPCPNCKGKRLSCSKCYGRGKLYTKTGQDIIDFITPIIKGMIEDAIRDHKEEERERQNRL